MSCINNIQNIECRTKNPTFEESIKFLPDSIRKEIRLLIKQYDIVSLEQCDHDKTYNEHGEIISLYMDPYYGNMKIIDQQFDVKITYRHKETKETFYLVLLSY